MSPQIPRKKAIFFTIIFTVLISVAALLFLWSEERNAHPVNHAQPLAFSGEYFIDEETEAHPFGNASDISLSREIHTLTFVGHFDREIEKNEPITLHLNNAHFRLFVNDSLILESGESGSVLPMYGLRGISASLFPRPASCPQIRCGWN